MRRILATFFVFYVFVNSAAVAEEWNPLELSTAQHDAVIEGIKDDLLDPESARFKDIEAAMDSNYVVIVCGVVNSKNRFGGYVGDSPFIGILIQKSNNFVPIEIGGKYPDIVHNMCAEHNMPFF